MNATALPGRWPRLPLYVGGLLGPFGTVVILPMFPELRESFNASSVAVGWGFTIYMLPFAAMLLVSGTLGERWGRRRTIRVTYLLFAVASLLCAIAPSLWVFLVGRALQGMANAFITPLLISGLAELVSAERFGRAVGVYSSFQAIGGGLAPLIGGIAADVNWRWAFVGVAAVAAVLSLAPVPGEAQSGVRPPMFASLLTSRMMLFGIGVFAAAAGPIGINVLVGVTARDVLELSGRTAGLVLLVGPIVAMLTGPLWGRLLDRWGATIAGVVAATAVTISAGSLAFTTTALSLAIGAAVAAGLTGFVVVVVQAMATTIIPDNRGGALSFVLAFRFLGHGVGPVLWIPVLESDLEAAYLGAAALGLITIGAFWLTASATRTGAATTT